jgi:hypothetical protein
VVCRSIKDLKTKADRFVADTEIESDKVPSAAVDELLAGQVGIRTGIDENQPAAIMLLHDKYLDRQGGGWADLFEPLVFVVPLGDRDKMAANFDRKAADLKAGETFAAGNGHVAIVRHQHLIIGRHEKAVRYVAEGKAVAKTLPAERARALESADVLLRVNLRGRLADSWRDTLKTAEERLGKAALPIDPDVRRPLFQTLASCQELFATVQLEAGLHLRFMPLFAQEMPEAATKLLGRLEGGASAAALAGLPDGPVIAAQAARADGLDSAFLLGLLFHYLDSFQGGVPFLGDSLDPAQRLTVAGVATEVWKKQRGHRAAIYRNAEPIKQGLYSVVAILDTDDPARFLGEVKQLARFASNAVDLSEKPTARDDVQTVKQLIQDLDDGRFAVRQSATIKLELLGEPVLPYLNEVLKAKPSLELQRRAEAIKVRITTALEERRTGLLSDVTRRLQPSFAYLSQAEKEGDNPIDILRIKLSSQETPAAFQFRQFFGPDWNKVRVAVHGKQVVLLWGSDTRLLAEALRNLKDGKPGLAGAKTLAPFTRDAGPGHKIEFHASLQSLLGRDAGGHRPPLPSLTSVALAVHPDRLQFDLRLPASEIRFLHREFERRRK